MITINTYTTNDLLQLPSILLPHHLDAGRPISPNLQKPQSMVNGQQPAFAFEETLKDSYGADTRNQYYGLTKREYLAAMAMQGMLAATSTGKGFVNSEVTYAAVEIADALLKELDK